MFEFQDFRGLMEPFVSDSKNDQQIEGEAMSRICTSSQLTFLWRDSKKNITNKPR